MICVDASVVIKWASSEVRSSEARALLEACGQRGIRIVAPSLVRYELVNIARQRVRRGLMTQDRAMELLDELLSFPVDTVDARGMHRDALTLADTANHGAAYDAHYVALARAWRCHFWTDDLRLVQSLPTDVAFVRWLGDFAGEP